MLFDPDTGLGLEIVRYNIGGSNTSQAAINSMRPFAAIPSMVLADSSYNWTLVSSSCNGKCIYLLFYIFTALYLA